MSRDETESESTATSKTLNPARRSELSGQSIQPSRIAAASETDYLPTDLVGRWLLRFFTGIEILRSWIARGAPRTAASHLLEPTPATSGKATSEMDEAQLV